MFGFSIQKLIFTILIIVIVIYGFKAIARLQDGRGGADKDAGGRGGGARPAKRADTAEEMVACPTCGTFVAARGARSCGRDDCPYPG